MRQPSPMNDYDTAFRFVTMQRHHCNLSRASLGHLQSCCPADDYRAILLSSCAYLRTLTSFDLALPFCRSRHSIDGGASLAAGRYGMVDPKALDVDPAQVQCGHTAWYPASRPVKCPCHSCIAGAEHYIGQGHPFHPHDSLLYTVLNSKQLMPTSDEWKGVFCRLLPKRPRSRSLHGCLRRHHARHLGGPRLAAPGA